MDCHYVQHWNFVIRFVPQAVFVAQPVPQKNVQQVGFCRWILGCVRAVPPQAVMILDTINNNMAHAVHQQNIVIQNIHRPRLKAKDVQRVRIWDYKRGFK